MSNGAGTLADKCCLVTAASRGIGAATAVELARAGARAVGINYLRNAEAARSVADRIREIGATPVLLPADVRRRDEVAAMVARFIEAAGELHVLVNNAGHLIRRVSVEDVTPEHLDELLRLNIYSAVFVTQACLPHLRRCAPSAIVNVGSIAARNGGGKGRHSILYAGAKAFVHTFTIGMAAEYAEHGIRVNCVAPGVIETDFHRELTGPERLAAIAAASPLRRNGRPEEVARAVVFLAGSQAAFITGATLDVNGGLDMHW